MCGRFQLDINPDRLFEIFGVPEITGFRRRWNIAPTQGALVIRAAGGKRAASTLRWGLVPFWADDETIGSRMINARAESARTKPAYRAAFKSRRCLIPATGFYEWRATPGKRKRPYLITPREGEVLALAGLWERWEKGDRPLETFTILTTSANEDVRDLHDRMPVALDESDWRVWLESDEADEAEALLKPAARGSLDAIPISTRINSPANDDPGACSPVGDIDPKTGGEKGLFG